MGEARFLGIDLGTTNSVAALSDGERAEFVRTADGSSLLPSVVRIDARGQTTIGARAKRMLEIDPENTRSEFKRVMGSSKRFAFKSAGKELSPEALSGLVLGALRELATTVLGHPPEAAVITVPALFELPQTRATSEAARLAGFDRVEHVQEPVASALTAGWKQGDDPRPWLVYDLGGGTFDVSLLETREGVLRVVGHDGDNFLGGRDMDARLLDLVLQRLRGGGSPPLERKNPALNALFRKLRAACEEAKFELGAGRNTSVSLPDPVAIDGVELLVDVPIDVAAFDAAVTPLIDQTAVVCARLLAQHGVAPASLGRVVLVGGPTVMPVLRRRLEERLGATFAPNIDPMTAVAEGAALFASQYGLPTQRAVPKAPGKTIAAAATRGPAVPVWLQFPSVSADLYPFVVGRIVGAKGASVVADVRLEREDGGWQSEAEPVGADGSFLVQAELAAKGLTTFTLTGRGPNGEALALDPGTVSIRHGLSLADPPLSRTIGIALANGGVSVFFERGAPLPSRKTFRLRTSLTLRPGTVETAISVPIVQGEVAIARLCRLVGTIEIRPEGLPSTVPVGSPVDVVLELDRAGRLTATAHLPDQNVTFPGTLVLVAPDAPVAELEPQHARLRRSLEALYVDANLPATARPKLVAIDSRLTECEGEIEAALGGDTDAVEKARRMLIDAESALADVEGEKTWPELLLRGEDIVAAAIHWTSRTGTDSDRRALEEALRSLDRARAVRDAGEFTRRLDNVSRISNAAFVRDPEALTRLFHAAGGRIGEMRDPRAAERHLADGRSALERNDHDTLRRATFALYDLLPPREEVRLAAHGSGVER